MRPKAIFFASRLIAADISIAAALGERICLALLFEKADPAAWQADRLAAAHPGWTDEQIFQAARRIVIAELQHIEPAVFEVW